MKCKYEGIWSRAGCNEDAEPDSDYCDAHERQGSTARLRAVLAVVFIIAIGGCSGTCVALMVAGG